MQKTVSINVFILVALILVTLVSFSYAGFLFLAEEGGFTPKEQSKGNIQKDVDKDIEENSQEDGLLPIQYDNWKTYTSDSYKISFKYAPGWIVEEENSYLRVVPEYDEENAGEINTMLLINNVTKTDDSLSQYMLNMQKMRKQESDSLVMYEKITMWDMDAYIYFDNGAFLGWGYVVKINDSIYNIQFHGLDENSKMLNSISFK